MSGNQRTPDKVTVYCDDHIAHIRNYPRVVEPDDPDDPKRVLIDAEESPSWLQTGDYVTASNGGGDVYLADFKIAEIRVEDGDDDDDDAMVVLKE